MAFRDRLAALGDRVRFLTEDTDGRPDLDAIMKSVPSGGLVDVCRPVGLLHAVQAAAEAAHGVDQDVVRFELFSRARVEPSHEPGIDAGSYDFGLDETGHTLRLEPDANSSRPSSLWAWRSTTTAATASAGSCVIAVRSSTVDHRVLELAKREHNAMDQLDLRLASDLPRLELDLGPTTEQRRAISRGPRGRTAAGPLAELIWSPGRWRWSGGRTVNSHRFCS